MWYFKGNWNESSTTERLKKKYAEFQQTKLPNCPVNPPVFPSSVNGKPVEVRGYDSKMIHEGDFSFEEIRAMNWYAKPKISKPSISDLTKLRNGQQRVIVPQLQAQVQTNI